MGTITGYTAARMKEIEDSAIVDGEVVGDDLILQRFDGGTINAGNVRGTPGAPGLTDLEEQLDAFLLLVDPPGIPKPYTGAAAPSGYGICDAATEYDGATYPSLGSLYGLGAGCVNGASSAGKFRLPNLKGRVLVGRDAAVSIFDTLHEVGGSRDSVNVQHNHEHNHEHSHDHNHNGGALDGGIDHTHDTGADGHHDHSPAVGAVFAVSVGGPQDNRLADTATTDETGAYISFEIVDPAGGHTHTVSASSGFDHTHPLTIDGDNTSDATTDATDSGVSGTDKNVPPYRVVNYIMRLT